MCQARSAEDRRTVGGAGARASEDRQTVGGAGARAADGPVIFRPHLSQTTRAPPLYVWASYQVGYLESAFGYSHCTGRWGPEVRGVLLSAPGGRKELSSPFSLSQGILQAEWEPLTGLVISSCFHHRCGCLGDVVSQATRVLAVTVDARSCPACDLGRPLCFGPGLPPLKLRVSRPLTLPAVK